MKGYEAVDQEDVIVFEAAIDSVFEILEKLCCDYWDANRVNEAFHIQDTINNLQNSIDAMAYESD